MPADGREGRGFLGLFYWGLAWVLLVVSAPVWAQRIIRPAIPVQSQDTRFIRAVHAALELLRARSPEDFEFALAHVGRIKEVVRWEEVGMAIMDNPPTAKLRARDITRSETWTAAAIVHEACHRHQYVRASARVGGGFPPNYEFSGRIAELECLKRQGDVLEKLGAPQREIAYVRGQDGRHYRKDEFGRYYKSPPGGGVWWDPSAFDPREPPRPTSSP